MVPAFTLRPALLEEAEPELLPPRSVYFMLPSCVFGLAAIASVPGTAMIAAAIMSAAYFFFI